MIHPDNHPSLMVVERAGFLYEGQRADSYWMGPDEVADDVIYGLTRAQWTEWIERPTSRVEAIELVEPDEHNQRDLMRLQVHHSQNRMVAPVTVSFAQALLPETIDGASVVPWIRGVRAGGQWVGFVMVAEPTEHHPVPYLWRLLIDRAHQGRGIGTLILDALIEQCRAWGCDTLEVTWEEGIGSPRRFYEQYGFVPTGNVIDGETEGRIAFGRS